MRVFVLQRGCWTEWTIIAQTTIPRTRSLCSGLSTAHWPHPLLTDHIHSSLNTSTAHWPHPQLINHTHCSLTISTAHWPHPQLIDHTHIWLTTSTAHWPYRHTYIQIYIAPKIMRTHLRRWRTFSIYLCPLSFWLTLPRGVLFLSTSWCCSSFFLRVQLLQPYVATGHISAVH